MASVIEHVRSDTRIKLPAFDPELSRAGDQFATVALGDEPNEFAGTVGPYRYLFEGEDDLLHLLVVRDDGGPLSVSDGQRVAGFVLGDFPASLIWLKPGEYSQHFYFGHDDLLEHYDSSIAHSDPSR